LDADEFFSLVDTVLVEAGRSPLGSRSPEQAVIDVRDDDQVLQILAGPGSGKTEMLVWRVLFELVVRGTDSSRVMVTTFTRRAATDLNVRLVERSDALMRHAHDRGVAVGDPRIHDVRVGTIHSLCDSLLAEFDPVYMAEGLQLIDEFEALVRVSREHRWLFGFRPADTLGRDVLSHQPLVSLFRPFWEGLTWPSSVPDRVECIRRLIAHQTETWEPRCAPTGQLNGIETSHRIPGLTAQLVEVQRRWEDYLDQNSILDFTTIQKRFRDRQNTVVDKLDHVFVDEFQDTNPVQFAIHIRWLDHSGTRLTVVGDDDQSVYRFRGSDIQCFAGLEAACRDKGARFRLEKLEENHRSSARIVSFAEAFRRDTVLATISMPKAVRSPIGTPDGEHPRLMEGPWSSVVEVVAEEIHASGAGRPVAGEDEPPTVALMMFSTSERSSTSPALALRSALESRGIRVYNPQNKTATSSGSPVFQLFGLVSYLIDPVSKAPVGAGGRPIEVWASSPDPTKARAAISAPPSFRIAQDHATIQKGFLKSLGGRIGAPAPQVQPLVQYIDDIRARLLTGGGHRLTLAGLVSRLLAFEYFRSVGFTRELFREALFTGLLESNIAATRRTARSLDRPLVPTRDATGKVVWPDQYWNLLGTFGSLLTSSRLDDPDVESFQDGSVSLLTFHQAKGLEFDHVYVAMTGRGVQPSAVLLTMLFSGEPRQYDVATGQPMTADPDVLRLATADREREVYVAMTRGRSRLTVLHDPSSTYFGMDLNPGISALFAGSEPTAIAPLVTQRTAS
jgi:DNA helicase-2/ATP-dependent DNA helicase PcrA